MLDHLTWVFFDVGSTLVDEHLVYEHIFRDMAELTSKNYEDLYAEALELYKQNKNGDIELCKKYNLPKREWHIEDERLYIERSVSFSYRALTTPALSLLHEKSTIFRSKYGRDGGCFFLRGCAILIRIRD